MNVFNKCLVILAMVAPRLVTTFLGNWLYKVVPVNSIGRMGWPIALYLTANACVVSPKFSCGVRGTVYKTTSCFGEFKFKVLRGQYLQLCAFVKRKEGHLPVFFVNSWGNMGSSPNFPRRYL